MSYRLTRVVDSYIYWILRADTPSALRKKRDADTLILFQKVEHCKEAGLPSGAAMRSISKVRVAQNVFFPILQKDPPPRYIHSPQNSTYGKKMDFDV